MGKTVFILEILIGLRTDVEFIETSVFGSYPYIMVSVLANIMDNITVNCFLPGYIVVFLEFEIRGKVINCLLYTSDAADEL